MDCPYIVRVDPETLHPHLWDSDAGDCLKWLKQNNITRFRWKWTEIGSSLGIVFRFENENDKLLFALRWA